MKNWGLENLPIRMSDGSKPPQFEQKFKRGDMVHVLKNLGEAMSHFPSDFDGIVYGSYNDMYGDKSGIDESHQYGLILVDGTNSCAWYPEGTLTLVKEGGDAELKAAYRKLNATLEASR